MTSAARADDACATFTWNVEHERSLFALEAEPLAAGANADTAPNLASERLYELRLREQAEVKFVVPPGSKQPADGAHAGIARLTVDTGGVYRVALDQKAWVDVLVNDMPLQPKDFQGRPGCNAPHKIVEFLLPARTPIAIQFSASSSPSVKLTVTRAPL